MRPSDTIKTLNQEIRKLKGELSQLQRARRGLKRKSEGVVF